MINILFCSDDKYAPKLAVAMSSLLDLNRDIRRELNIIIRTNDMTAQTRVGLKDIIDKYYLNESQFHIVYTDGLCEKLEQENVKKFKNSYLCYFKLFGLDELIEEQMERLLVIDCDTLICDSIVELYRYDLQGKAVGAVREFRANHSKHGGSEIGEYNTGVLLYDMEKYLKMDIEKKLKAVIGTIPEEEWITGDQTVFTLALEQAELVETLPLKYNFIINQFAFSYREFMYIRNMKECDYYSEKEYEDARERPCIMHLITGEFIISPWYYGGNRKIKRIWDMYLRDTMWGNNRQIDVYIPPSFSYRIRSRMCWILHHCLPRKLSMRIFKILFESLQ